MGLKSKLMHYHPTDPDRHPLIWSIADISRESGSIDASAAQRVR